MSRHPLEPSSDAPGSLAGPGGRSFEELQRALAELHVPTGTGRLAGIIRRPASGQRDVIQRILLSVAEGIPGNRWGSRIPQDPEGQIAVMRADVAELIAGARGATAFALFGDNLFMELDLSVEALPPGSRVRVGTAVLELAAKPHTGCSKFLARFGPGALKLVSDPGLRHLNLRGIYLRVVDPGEIAEGDTVNVAAPGRG